MQSQSIGASYKNLLFKKLYNAIVFSILSQCLILFLCLIVINGNILDPITFLKTSWDTLTSFTLWLHVLPHLAVVFAQCVICAKDYVLNANFSSNRFQMVIHLLSLHNSVLFLLHSLVGIVQVWLILKLGGGRYNQVSRSLNRNTNVLVQETLFMLLGGFWNGLYFFWNVYMRGEHLTFPIIQQRKSTQFKLNFLPNVKRSFLQSIWPSVYFIALHYIWGNVIAQNISYIFELQPSGDFNYVVYLYHFFFASLFYLNMNMIKIFFSMFLTDIINFPITKQQQNILTLQEAINLNDVPIIQNLACLDLYSLSIWSPERRQLLFSLSQPGERPHNWNSLVEACLQLFNSYINILDKATNDVIDKACISSQCQKPIANKFEDLRNMSSTVYSFDTSKLVDVHKVQSAKEQEQKESILKGIKVKISNILYVIKVIFGINYFFEELPHANIQKCLSKGQILIWNCQALSEIICVSLKEDQYGIVQKDLPRIVSTLLRLSQALDKLNKIHSLSRKNVGSENVNYKMKNAISSSLQRCLFNMSHTFRNNSCEFSLDKDICTYVNSNILCY